MTLQEKLARETGREIYLYKQGVFWVAYEQSALLLSLKKDLKPSPPCPFFFLKKLPRLHNIVFIRFNADEITAHFFSNPGCGPASREQIQDQPIFLATDLQEPFNNFFRLLRRVKSYIFPLFGRAFNEIVHLIHAQEIEQPFLLLEK